MRFAFGWPSHPCDRMQIPPSDSISPMPNIATLLKSEITRLARNEAKAFTDPIRKSNARHPHASAAWKRQVADLERQLARASRARDSRPTPDTDNTPTLRFTAKGLQTHRAKLGLSAG